MMCDKCNKCGKPINGDSVEIYLKRHQKIDNGSELVKKIGLISCVSEEYMTFHPECFEEVYSC